MHLITLINGLKFINTLENSQLAIAPLIFYNFRHKQCYVQCRHTNLNIKQIRLFLKLAIQLIYHDTLLYKLLHVQHWHCIHIHTCSDRQPIIFSYKVLFNQFN